MCSGKKPMPREDYEAKVGDSQLVTINGKKWRLVLAKGGVTWESTQQAQSNINDKQGHINGCGLAEPPPCPVIVEEDDMGELTMADQISMQQRVHIRQDP